VSVRRGYLGHPSYDPHGEPIPAADGTLEPDPSFPLAAASGGRVCVSRVGHEDSSTLAFLEGIGLVPGRELDVKEVRALDGVVTVEDEDGETHVLGSRSRVLSSSGARHSDAHGLKRAIGGRA
jgi:hypothetical protein